MRGTPPLLRKMFETWVGELVVHGGLIIETRTGCCVARGFPSEAKAVAAASAMNEVADWLGVIKSIAAGGKPNCIGELRRIVESHGGKLADGAGKPTRRVCEQVAAKAER